jgi:uncharacterized membrane protein
LAAGLFTHPNGIVAVLLFHLLILFRYRKRLTVTVVLLAAVPYIAAALLWGAYILQNTSDFAAQMDANAAGRFRLWARPWVIPVDGFRRLLLTPFGFGGMWAGPATRLKVVVLLIYLFATILVVVKREWARRPGVKEVLVALLVSFLVLSSIVSANDNDYVIFLIPWFCVLLGMVVVNLWRTRIWRFRVGPALLGLVLLFQLGMTGARVRINDMRSHTGQPWRSCARTCGKMRRSLAALSWASRWGSMHRYAMTTGWDDERDSCRTGW